MKRVGKKKYYSLKEAARFLGEPIENIRSWIEEGELPAPQVIDGQTVIPAILLNDFYHGRLPIIERRRREAGQIKKASEKLARKEQQAKQVGSTTPGQTGPQARTLEENAYYYTPAQVAEMLATDLLGVNQLVHRGELTAISVDKHRWFLAKDVEDVVRQKYGPGRLVHAPKPRLIRKPEKREAKKIEPKICGAARKQTDSEPEPKIEPSAGSNTHYTVDEAAKKLGKSYHEVWRMGFLGELRIETVGDQKMFLKRSVDALLRNKKPSAGGTGPTDAPKQEVRSPASPTDGGYYSAEEVADKLGEDVDDVWHRVYVGQLEIEKVRGERVFPKQAVDDLILEGKKAEAAQEKSPADTAGSEQAIDEPKVEYREEDLQAGEGYYYTSTQAAELLGRDTRDIYRLVRQNVLPASRAKGYLWIPARAVDDLVKRWYGDKYKLPEGPRPSKIEIPEQEDSEKENPPAIPTAQGSEDRPSADPAIAPTTAAHSSGEIDSAEQASPVPEASSASRKSLAERAEEDRRRVTEAAQRLGKSPNQVRQMRVAGQLVLDPESGRLVTPHRGSDGPTDDRAAEKKPPHSRLAHTEAQELEEEKMRALRDELRIEKEEKEHLSEELERERQNVSETQREIDQLEAELENGRRDYEILSETLREDLEEERSRRTESEQRAKELQEQLDKEIARKLPAGDSLEGAPTNDNLYDWLRDGVRGVVGSLKDPECPESELEKLKAELEKEQGKRLAAEESLTLAGSEHDEREEYEEQLAAVRSELEEEKKNRQRIQPRLEENEAEKKALEEALSLEKERTRRLETDKRLLDQVRRLLGTMETVEPSEPNKEIASNSVNEDYADEASGKLILKTPFGQVSFLPPFPLAEQDEELLRLIAREDELTAEQIRNLTGSRRAHPAFEDLLERLADEGIKLVEEVSEDRYRFNPTALQND